MKEPMKLEIKNGGIRGPRLVLDGKELHHVKGYEIKDLDALIFQYVGLGIMWGENIAMSMQ